MLQSGAGDGCLFALPAIDLAHAGYGCRLIACHGERGEWFLTPAGRDRHERRRHRGGLGPVLAAAPQERPRLEFGRARAAGA